MKIQIASNVIFESRINMRPFLHVRQYCPSCNRMEEGKAYPLGFKTKPGKTGPEPSMGEILERAREVLPPEVLVDLYETKDWRVIP